MASLVITILLSLVNIASAVALEAIVSLTIAALVSSYIISISCLLLKRIRGEPLPPHRWTLGRWGMAINIASLCFLLPVFVFSFFPLTSTVDPTTMNWSIVMYGGVTIFSTTYYVFVGRHHYTPPVNFVKRA
jgi:amino acid transporter